MKVSCAPPLSPWRRARTDPSPMANWVTPVCRLLNVHQPSALPFISLPPAGRPQAVGSGETSQLKVSGGLLGLYPSPRHSPNISVLLDPSAPVNWFMVRAER